MQNILVVEDDYDLNQAICYSLKKSGSVFNCNWRRNGKWEDHIPGGFVRVHTKR